MKKTTLTTLIIISIVFLFSTLSYAQRDSSTIGSHDAMAYLALKEIRAKEQNAAANKEKKDAANVTVTINADGRVKKTNAEKIDVVEE